MVTGEKAVFKIDAQYYAGGKVTSGNVSYQLYQSRFDQPLFAQTGLESFYSQGEYRSFKPELVKTGSANLSNGESVFEFETSKSNFNYYYNLQVTVTDSSRGIASGSGSIKVSPARIKMDIKTNQELYNIEDQIIITVKAVDIEDNPVSNDFTIDVVRKGRENPKGGWNWFWGNEKQEPEIAPKKLKTLKGKTDEKGFANVEIPATEAGEIVLTLQALDENQNRITVEKNVWVGKENEPLAYSGDSVKIVTDQKAYSIGDVAQILEIGRASCRERV